MLVPNKKRQEVKDLNELALLKNQEEEFRLQDEVGKQNFQEDMKKVFEPVTKSISDVFEEVTKITTESSNNNKEREDLNNKILGKMNDRGILESYLMSP